MAKRLYWTLLVRENSRGSWCIHFGDYSLSVVRQERSDICEHEYRKSNTLIIYSVDDQVSINAAVTEVNR